MLLLVEGIEILQNDLQLRMPLTNKMTLNLTARYYWSLI
jgi:hypothetical protein